MSVRLVLVQIIGGAEKVVGLVEGGREDTKRSLVYISVYLR